MKGERERAVFLLFTAHQRALGQRSSDHPSREVQICGLELGLQISWQCNACLLQP